MCVSVLEIRVAMEGRASQQSKLEVARTLRTKRGYLDLARALLFLAAREDSDAMHEVAFACVEGDWG
jgi:hypothetical protein